MMAGSHVVLGLAAWTWVAPRLGLPALDPVCLVLAAGGALLPDIDHPKSWAGRRCRMVSRPLAAIAGHRGFTHSLLAVVLGLYLLHAPEIPRAVAAPIVVGYLSHLAADLLTPAGLRLAWPHRRAYALPLCRTGSVREVLLVAGIVVWAGLAGGRMR